ncbi:MAG: D-aminoacyl-tRNA deacylase, partial [Thermoproteota archaeon]
CHSTGNFSEAKFGGNDRQIAIPHPYIQKEYLQTLWKNKSQFSDFQITIEATHHGPTALTKPAIFIEIGTTEKQWTDVSLCNSVAGLVHSVMTKNIKPSPVAICFGGTHYPDKFTKELLEGKFALGTVVPKHALDNLDEDLFLHILKQNKMAKTALLDWGGLGSNKQKLINFLNNTDLEVIKL